MNDLSGALVLLQNEHARWLEHNFPEQLAHEPLLGLMEELGELSHAHLKAAQGIRGDLVRHRAEASDAIGDIIIYLLSYCNANGYSLALCLENAWGEVRKRDWVKYPETGVSP